MEMYSAYFFVFRSKLDREGRALCRLLYNDGRAVSDIAEIVEVAEVTVTRAVRNSYATKDKISDDYKFVDDELIDRYNITTPSTARNTQTVEMREAARDGEETQSAVHLIPLPHWTLTNVIAGVNEKGKIQRPRRNSPGSRLIIDTYCSVGLFLPFQDVPSRQAPIAANGTSTHKQ
jgi:hypothetical protein